MPNDISVFTPVTFQCRPNKLSRAAGLHFSQIPQETFQTHPPIVASVKYFFFSTVADPEVKGRLRRRRDVLAATRALFNLRMKFKPDFICCRRHR